VDRILRCKPVCLSGSVVKFSSISCEFVKLGGALQLKVWESCGGVGGERRSW
jgi:hypothetical protein